MKLSIIVATAEQGVIGKDNQLIWHLPEDLKMFRRLTTGHVIIMGRKTFESIGKPLPNRTSIIISRNTDYQVEGCIVVGSLEEAIEKAKEIESEEAFIIGGAQIYALALDMADTVYLTQVHHNFEGDVFFPVLDTNIWTETERKSFQPDEKHAYAFDFVTLEKRTDKV
ncbi:dihydrofolate reductase [Cellulophaga sp. BC115SP]|uniref:dihydrofolate reductase n=1 Tax=Cellulophaga sp. BC115SP TaxID=2683263 RepID=UPI001411EBC2|nr:dihydrofolate reductase [Cellulophaga sp. BC115SP]NBB31499.1 dihydrofolate reductase [Cellulophaga sp. BC115SP]